MYAVILTGGKQYRVKKGDLLSIEKLEAEKGKTVEFRDVLLVEDGKKIHVGTPVLEGALVRAEVMETFKDEKVIVFKKKRRKQYRRTRGHRQHLTKIQVEGIFLDKKVPAAKVEKKEKAPAAPKKVEAKKVPEKVTPAKKAAPKAKKTEPEVKTKTPRAAKTAAKPAAPKSGAKKPAAKKAVTKKTESKKPAAKKPAAKTAAKPKKTTTKE